MVRDQRPVNLNLMTIRQPITAIVSILHRITGLILFLSLPLILWALRSALASPEDYNAIANYCLMPIGKTLSLLIWAAFVFHFFAGCRHIIMDFGWGESLARARFGAYLVIILTVIFIFLGGLWLC